MADTDLSIIPEDFNPPEESSILIERNKVSGWEDLSHQKKAFAYEYLSNGYKHRKAATHAGIAENSGLKVLREPLVSAFIAELQEKHFTSAIITKQFVESQYLELIPFLKGEEEIPIVTGQGEEKNVYKFHASELVGVLRDLSKVTGYQQEEEKNKGMVNIQMNFGAVMDDPEIIINEK